MKNILKRLLSYVVVIPEHRFHSEYSGKMDVRWEGGRLVLNSPMANYSFNDKEVSNRFLNVEFFDLPVDNLVYDGQIMFNYIGDQHPFYDYVEARDIVKEVLIDKNRVLIYRRTEVS